MRAVIRGVIQESIKRNPWHIRISHYNPIHEHVFEEASWLEKYASFKTIGDTLISFWQNKSDTSSKFLE